jgi:hypothetical protein
LKLGVRIDTLGHGAPLGRRAGAGVLATVHGQPILPGGGGGSCSRVGQRKMNSGFGERLAEDKHWILSDPAQHSRIQGLKAKDQFQNDISEGVLWHTFFKEGRSDASPSA